MRTIPRQSLAQAFATDSVCVLVGITNERGTKGYCRYAGEERGDGLQKASKRGSKDPSSVVAGEEVEKWGQRPGVSLFGSGQMKEFSLFNEAGHQLGHEERLWDVQSFEIRGEPMNNKK